MRAAIAVLACVLLSTVGAAAADGSTTSSTTETKYFKISKTPVAVTFQGLPLSDVRLQFTDAGKRAVNSIMSKLKVKVGNKEIQLTNVARKIREVQTKVRVNNKVKNLVNTEYVVGAIGYEVPEKFFLGYFQYEVKKGEVKKYLVYYDEKQQAVIKSAPGFGEFNATAVQLLGEYDGKGLPLIAPSIDPTEFKDQTLLCLPVYKDITVKPAVLQIDWYTVIEEAELGKIFAKVAKVYAHSEGDKIQVIYVPTKVDALQVLVGGENPVIPKESDLASEIVSPYINELKGVVEKKIQDMLKPIQENVKDNPVLNSLVGTLIPKLLDTMVDKQMDQIESELEEAVAPYVRNLRTLLTSLYMSLYPEKVNVDVLEARKEAYDSPLRDVMESTLKTCYDELREWVENTVSSVIDNIVEQYGDQIANLVGTTASDVKKTLENLTVGVLDKLLTGEYWDYLIKLAALDALTVLHTMGIL